MTTLEDVEKVFSSDGAMETFLRAKKEGLIRHIGFSAHSEEAALALMDRFNFDSVLFPINWVNIFNANFAPKVIEIANLKNMGILALKAMAKTVCAEGADKKYPKAWYEPIDEKQLAQLAFRYTLSKPITAALTPGDIKHFRWALPVVKDFKVLTPEEENNLRNLAKGIKPIFPEHK